jgi:hypothetical protein
MIPLLPLTGKRKRFRIAEATPSLDPNIPSKASITHFVDYSRSEQERFSIASQLFDRDNNGEDNAVDDDGDRMWGRDVIQQMTPDMRETRLKLSRQVDIEKIEEIAADDEDGDSTTENGDTGKPASSAKSNNLVNKGAEHLQMALAEMSCMLTLTGLLNPKEYFTFDVKHLMSARSHHGHHQQQRGLQTRGVPLPNDQLVDIYKNNYTRAATTLQASIQSCRDSISRRRLYLNGVHELRKYWRIVNIGSRAVNNNSNDTVQMVAVDCSYYAFGDISELALRTTTATTKNNLNNNNDKLIPLEMSVTGPALSTAEVSKPAQTLQLSVHVQHAHGSDNSSSSEKCVTSMNCWSISDDDSDQNTVDASIRHLHQQLVKKRHDTFCKKLFADMKTDAISGADRWIVTPDTSLIADRLASSGHMDSDDDGDIDNAVLLEESLLHSLDIHSVSAQQFTVKLSDKLSLRIALIEIPDDGFPVTFRSSVEGTMHGILENALKAGLFRAQCSLLHQFKLNLQVLAQVNETQSLINAELAKAASATSMASSQAVVSSIQRDAKINAQALATALTQKLGTPPLTADNLRCDVALRRRRQGISVDEDEAMMSGWQSQQWLHRHTVSVVNASTAAGSGSALVAASSTTKSAATFICSGVLQSLLYSFRTHFNFDRVQLMCSRLQQQCQGSTTASSNSSSNGHHHSDSITTTTTSKLTVGCGRKELESVGIVATNNNGGNADSCFAQLSLFDVTVSVAYSYRQPSFRVSTIAVGNTGEQISVSVDSMNSLNELLGSVVAGAVLR